jgi:hypothetical protein
MIGNLNQEERQIVAEQFMALGNLSFGALVVGQVVGKGFNFIASIGGVIMIISAYQAALIIMRRGE